MTVLQSVCSHGHKLKTSGYAASVRQWETDQERATTLRPNAARWSPRRVSSCLGTAVKKMDWPMTRENGGTVFLLLPEVSVLRRPSWNRVFSTEELTTKIPWYYWSGRRRYCWWRR